MEHLKLFPTTVGGVTDLEIAERLMPFARKILDIDGNNSNTWNYKTSYSSTPSNINELEFFSEYTKDLGNKYLNSIGYKSLDLHCDFFFSEMFEEDLHPLHEHPNTVLSGLIYLQVPEGSSDLRFHDPRFHTKVTNLPIIESKDTNWMWYDVTPEKGLVLIWPGWVAHEVLKNQSKEGRITAVFNLTLLSSNL